MRDGKEDGNSLIFQSYPLCNDLRVVSRLQLYLQFIHQLNYENDVKIRFKK